MPPILLLDHPNSTICLVLYKFPPSPPLLRSIRILYSWQSIVPVTSPIPMPFPMTIIILYRWTILPMEPPIPIPMLNSIRIFYRWTIFTMESTIFIPFLITIIIFYSWPILPINLPVITIPKSITTFIHLHHLIVPTIYKNLYPTHIPHCKNILTRDEI